MRPRLPPVVTTRGGNDTITAQGGNGAGSAYASVNQLRMFGESERNGGEIGETNTFTGRDDRDYIVGGGTGLQTMNGLDGGADNDTAYYDRFDTVTNVEQAFQQ
jgi:hypothetical protein